MFRFLSRTARTILWLTFALPACTMAMAQQQDQLPATPQPQKEQPLGKSGIAGLPDQPMQSAKDAQAAASNPNGLSWDDVKARFLANNPSLAADQSGVEESRAEEITAYLRPNPQLQFNLDQLYPYNNPKFAPFQYALTTGSISYLHERQHKRELRLKSAQQATLIATFTHTDLERTMIFNLRSQFVDTLQAKATLALTIEELKYYDHLIDINRERWEKGDIAEIDFQRIELQRTQYESDYQAAVVDLLQSKIVLLQMMNDRSEVTQFDIRGDFDYQTGLPELQRMRDEAIVNRPDLRAAMETIDQSVTNNKLAIANGSTDPTFSVDAGANPPLDPYVGIGVGIPLRIFDRNQGEKLRTKIDIQKSTQTKDAAALQVFADVDSAYAQVASTLELLRSYKSKYLDEATHVRDTVTYAYQRGGASLLDLLNAQDDFRTVEKNYLQLIGTYLTAAAQLNEAVGREELQ